MERMAEALLPLPYHVELRNYLKQREPEVWRWFASAKAKSDYTEQLRLDLLKSTYRLDADGHPQLYAALDDVKARLDLRIPVTVYQAQQAGQSNAALYFIPGEGHLVFSGPLLSLLDANELKSVLAHELAHYHLWQCDDGEFHVATRVLQAVADDLRARSSHIQSARWFQLYTEIFADRGSFAVTNDIHPVIASLLKLQTGLSQVSATSYLKQADEIFAKSVVKTEGVSHPEDFIRARALALWAANREEATNSISAMIENASTLDELDLLGQLRTTNFTRSMLQRLLRPKWFQTNAVLGHARLFFSDFKPATTREDPDLYPLRDSDAALRDYLCYLLLDFTVVDPDLDEMPLAAALELSRELNMDANFEKLVARELHVKARDVKRLKEQAAAMLARAETAS